MMESTRPLVLLVDDEPDLLAGLSRSLRSERFEISTAPSGAAALAMLRTKNPFAVIVSDLRMPEMDGVALLQHAREYYPNTVRVLFTGQLDMERAIAAVNKGSIFRFILKPCSRVSLALTLNDAIEQHRLLTAERVLLEQTLHGSIKALTDILSLAAPTAFGRATRLRQTVRSLAAACGVSQNWHIEVAAMLSQVGCVILPPTTVEKLYQGQQLSLAEQSMMERMPAISEQVLGNIPRLDLVREILRFQNKHFDGGGPPADAPGGEALPWGARALKLALDVDALESTGTPAGQIFETLSRRRGWYDPEILQQLVAIRNHQQRAQVRELPVAGLLPGMVLAQDVRTCQGVVFIARGQEVNISLIEKLRNFAANEAPIEDVCLIEDKCPKIDNNAPAEPFPRVLEQPAAGPASPTSDWDPVAGLPGRKEAECVFNELRLAEEPFDAIVLVIDSMAPIYSLLGRRAADQLMRSYAEFMARLKAPHERLFRWSGPTLLVLSRRDQNVDSVRDDFQNRLRKHKFEQMSRVSARAVHVPLSPRWTVLPSLRDGDVFIEKIDTFVGALIGREEIARIPAEGE